ncbi:MAG: diguanylate cyclase [Syntrophobacteraceae bacterium]
MTFKPLLSFFIPGSLLLLASVILMRADLPAALLSRIILIFPWVVPAAGMLLGWRFNRSRLVFAVLMLAAADRSLHYFAQGDLKSTCLSQFTFYAVAVLLPLNLAILSFMKERGILSASGVRRLCFIPAQPLAVAALYHYDCLTVCCYLDHPALQESFLKHLPASPFPKAALITGLMSFLLIGFRYCMVRGALECGFIWALATVFLALSSGRPGVTSTFYFSTAGLILVVSVIEASYAMAFHDELTGLPARRALNEFLLRTGTQYTVAMLDIDFFKKFNDRYGHDVGDQVLRMVASKISGVSGGGKAFRYGGEEFTVVFPGKSRDEAVSHLEQLRATIQSAGFTIRGSSRPRSKPKKPATTKTAPRRVSVTISIGVAEKNKLHENAQEVIKAADKALYRAKKAGRNRVST